MTTTTPPVVTTTSGAVRGLWRPGSAAFLGIPFAEAPVGDLRFAAPVPARAWDGVRDATAMGPTPQRRPLMDVTTIPEPSIPGDATLNVNVFTPRPGDTSARLPVLVWIHGGGYTAGSPASPWYDGRAFNRDGVVTVTLSYRLGFDGYGWIADAPTNRAVRDQILALAWVRDNIAEFGGDPAKVTIAGQSAGGGSVLWLLACPTAQGLFRGVISHSGAAPAGPLSAAESMGRAFADRVGVEPTRAGWSTLTETEILNHQGEISLDGGDPLAGVRGLVTGEGATAMLAWGPHVDGDLLPWTPAEAYARGIGADKTLLIGTVAHEFSMMFTGGSGGGDAGDAGGVGAGDEGAGDAAGVEGAGDAGAGDSGASGPFDGVPRDQLFAAAGLRPEAVAVVDQAFADMPTPLALGQVMTEFLFRVPALETTRRPGRTWLFDFRWPSPVLGLAYHCSDLPFAWGLLDAEGVPEALGANPPRALETAMHGAWVRFIADGDPGWAACSDGDDLGVGRPGMVFDTTSAVTEAPYGVEAELVGAGADTPKGSSV